MPGDRLGHFDLVEYVGAAGWAVSSARSTRNWGEPWRLRFSARTGLRPRRLAAFPERGQSSARLDHDNIARAYYLGEDRGLHYIVFEFVEGLNVRMLVERKGPLSLAEAVSYTLQVAEALAMPTPAVVHRDIKPSNMLITPEAGEADRLGLARLRHADPAVAT